MRKTALLGMSALAIGLVVTPMNTQAAGYISYGSQNGRIVVAGNRECSPGQLQDKLESLKGNGNVIVWGGRTDRDDCPVLPQQPGNGGSGNNGGNNSGDNNGNNNGGTEENKPGNPDIPQQPDADYSSYAREVVSLVNAERAKEGLAPLAIDEQVEKAAMVRAREIQSSFSHTRPDGSSFSTVLGENQVSYRGSGENIAWGQKTPQEVVTGWMNSPGHRANIMNKNFTTIGVGNLANSSGTMYWVQLFTY